MNQDNPQKKQTTNNDQSARFPGYPPIDLSGLKLYSVNNRQHLAEIDSLGKTPSEKISFTDWLDSLPDFLAAKRLRSVVDAIVASRKADKPVAFAMGGHVVKVGCGPIVIDLMKRGLVNAVACNGSMAIHDMELAMNGATSEDVGDTIRDGRFGMVRETADFFAQAADDAAEQEIGYGHAIGRAILKADLPYADKSILASAAELGVPATVHVAMGTDTIHMPPAADGAKIGQATLTDFRVISNVVYHMGADRENGVCGTWCNVGSAVIMPEIFLKAVSVARNLGADLDNLTSVNCDQLRHYRPLQNVVGRPVAKGRGFDLAGPHEILLPMLRQAVIERYPR
jgi:hypothetical protein